MRVTVIFQSFFSAQQIAGYYRAHPKDGESDVFTGVCLLSGGGGGGGEEGVPLASGPRFFLGGREGVQSWSRPRSRGMGYPCQDKDRCPRSPPGLDILRSVRMVPLLRSWRRTAFLILAKDGTRNHIVVLAQLFRFCSVNKLFSPSHESSSSGRV